ELERSLQVTGRFDVGLTRLRTTGPTEAAAPHRATAGPAHLVSTGGPRGAGMGDRDERFVEFVTARAADLRRTAYLLCGDWHRAEDLVQTSLIKLYRAWDKARGDGEAAYARRVLVRTAI